MRFSKITFHFERFWCQLVSILALFSESWGVLAPLGGILGRLGSVLGPCWAHLGASWHVLARLRKNTPKNHRHAPPSAPQKNPPASNPARIPSPSPSRPPPYNQPVGLKRNGSAQSASRHPPTSACARGLSFSLFALAFSAFVCVVVKSGAQPPCCPPIGDPGKGGGSQGVRLAHPE